MRKILTDDELFDDEEARIDNEIAELSDDDIERFINEANLGSPPNKTLVSVNSLKNECNNSIINLKNTLLSSENDGRKIPTGLNNTSLPEHVKKVLVAIDKDLGDNVINEQQAKRLLTGLNSLLNTAIDSITNNKDPEEIKKQTVQDINELEASMNELPEHSKSLFTLKNLMIAAVGVAVVAAIALFALSTAGIGPGVVGAGLLIASAFSHGGALASTVSAASVVGGAATFKEEKVDSVRQSFQTMKESLQKGRAEQAANAELDVQKEAADEADDDRDYILNNF